MKRFEIVDIGSATEFVGAGFTPARKSLLNELIPRQAEKQEQGHDQKSAT